MPTFIEITPDPFAEQFRKGTQGDANEDGSGAGSLRSSRSFAHVRRPVRGIVLKDDTYATLQVRKADGTVIPLLDGGGLFDDKNNPGVGLSEQYSNFILQNIQEERAEKTQVVQTFGAPFIFFFGEHPRVIQGSGVLINTEDFNWRAEFWENYDNNLRGSKCVQKKTRITLAWDDIVVEGYFIAASATENANEPGYVNFSFQIFLTNYANVSAIGASDFPRGSFEANLNPDEVDIPALNVLPAASSTQTVRQLNIANSRQQSNRGSLFQSLRDGISQVASFEGRLEALFNLTDRFIDTGKRVRVPRGFTGGSAFDVETQIALASVNPASQRVLIRKTVNGQDYYVQGRNGKLASPVRFGKFRDSEDEYIARFPQTGNDPTRPIQLVDDQEADYLSIERKVREVFARFGIEVDPPAESIILANTLQFGAVQVKIGTLTAAVGIPPLRDVLRSTLI